jgi:hypothetical protein
MLKWYDIMIWNWRYEIKWYDGETWLCKMTWSKLVLNWYDSVIKKQLKMKLWSDIKPDHMKWYMMSKPGHMK